MTINELVNWANEINVTIRLAKPGDGAKQGIHKLNPTADELEDALQVAERDLFETIYIHNSDTWLK